MLLKICFKRYFELGKESAIKPVNGNIKTYFQQTKKDFSCTQSKFREDKQSGNNTYAIWNYIELQSSVSSDNYCTVMQLVILKRKGTTWYVQGCAAGVGIFKLKLGFVNNSLLNPVSYYRCSVTDLPPWQSYPPVRFFPWQSYLHRDNLTPLM